MDNWTRRTLAQAFEISERLADPYALVPCVRSFHLAAHCHSRGEARIFKLDRIKAL